MKYLWTCNYAGCDTTKAPNSKYCPAHGKEMASRIGQAATRIGKRDTATADMFAPAAERLDPTPAARGQDTSEMAAASNQQKARGQAIVLLRYLAASKAGLTCDALEACADYSHQTTSARLYQMEKRGWIERLGATDATRSGSQAKVYTLTERGRDQLRAQAREYAGPDVNLRRDGRDIETF